MRKIFLSVLMQLLGTPVLGYSPGTPVAWVYGSQAPQAQRSVYAPQLQLSCMLQLQNEVEVRRDRLYIEDLARCEGPAGLCREVMGVEIAASPKPGQTTRIKRDALLALLKQEFPRHRFTTQGPEELKVRAIAVALDSNRLRTAIEDRLAVEEDGIRFRLQSVRTPFMLRLRHNDYRFEFPNWQEEFQKLRQFPRRNLVNLRVRAIEPHRDANEVIEWQAQLNVKAEVLALVAGRALFRGTLANEVDFSPQWLPYQENLLRDAKDLRGKTLRIAIKEGQALRNYELGQEPDIRRGDRVDASVLSGGVKMNSPGQAMETGAIGQKIRVQLDSTKRQVMGLIIAKAQVEVHMP